MTKPSTNAGMDRVTVPEAAKRLGLSENALRKRIQRGTIEHQKDPEGRVYVYLSPTMSPTMTGQAEDQVTNQAAGQAAGQADDQSQLVARLENEVEYLRREVEDWKEEARRKDTIIMTMAQRIPELEASTSTPSDARESPVTASEEPSRGEGREETETADKRPWWRRIFE